MKPEELRGLFWRAIAMGWSHLTEVESMNAPKNSNPQWDRHSSIQDTIDVNFDSKIGLYDPPKTILVPPPGPSFGDDDRLGGLFG
jgi:hypothetical protein